MKLKLMAAAALVAMGGAAQAQLLNGSFETPVVPSAIPYYTVYGNGADIGGWTVTSCGVACDADAVTLVNNQVNALLAGYTAADGNQWVDLTGDGNFGNSSISQTFGGLTVGQTYTLSFALGATSYHDAVVSVTANGGPASVFTTSASGSAGNFANVWNTYTMNFVAGASNTIQFTALAASGGPISVGIDSVAVVPEPSAYAMALAGLGALGFLARRRKNRA